MARPSVVRPTLPSEQRPQAATEVPVDAATQAVQQAAARAAADLLAGSLIASGNQQGSLSLADVLARCAEADRPSAIQAYWRLSRATSNYNWALDEQKRLDQVVSNRGSVDGPMLSTVRAAAAARATEADLEKTFATAALARAPTLNISGLAPSDHPLVGPYHTYYSQIFANRPVGRTWEIDRTLPVRLKAINDRAAAVQSAVSAVHYAEQAHAAGEVDLRTVLACHEALHTQRRDFLDAVLQYNLDIGEYALAAAPVGTPADKIAAMLIPVKQPERVRGAGQIGHTKSDGHKRSIAPQRWLGAQHAKEFGSGSAHNDSFLGKRSAR